MFSFSNSRYALGTAESAKSLDGTAMNPECPQVPRRGRGGFRGRDVPNAENTLIFLAPLALFAVKRELVRSVS